LYGRTEFIFDLVLYKLLWFSKKNSLCLSLYVIFFFGEFFIKEILFEKFILVIAFPYCFGEIFDSSEKCPKPSQFQHLTLSLLEFICLLKLILYLILFLGCFLL